MKLDISHDTLVKLFLKEREIVSSFIRLAVPTIAELLDLKRIKPIPTETFGRDFRKIFKDLAFKVPLKGEDQAAYIYIVIEHKSGEERFAAAQVLRYVAEIYYEESRRIGNKKRAKLPVVLPIIFAHGDSTFDVPVQFAELVSACPELEPFVPKMLIPLFDLMACQLEDLPKAEDDPELAAMLGVMRTVVTDEAGKQFVEIITRFLHTIRKPENRELLEAIWVYGLKYGEVTDEQVEQVLANATKIGDKDMGLTAIQRWEARGEVKASQDAIIRFLTARFGEVSDGLREKLQAIQSIEKLQQLTDTAATTGSISEFESQL